MAVIRFYERVLKDDRLIATHLSLYLGLLSIWLENGRPDQFRIDRKGVMERSKIKSIATYHKCIREMKDFGYIDYMPSFNTYEGSQVKLLFNL